MKTKVQVQAYVHCICINDSHYDTVQNSRIKDAILKEQTYLNDQSDIGVIVVVCSTRYINNLVRHSNVFCIRFQIFRGRHYHKLDLLIC